MRNMLERYTQHRRCPAADRHLRPRERVKNIIGGELKEVIENFPGLVGVRPDSGDVVQVTSDTTEWLMDAFGYATNSKGYKVLPDYIRVVQGDGVRRETLPKVFIEMERRGLAADNAVFGMGGGLLQHCNRDTMEFGMKANAVCVNGEWRDICKSPDRRRMKVSKAGRLALKYANGDYQTVAARLDRAGGEPARSGLPQRQAAEEVGLHRADRAQRARVSGVVLHRRRSSPARSASQEPCGPEACDVAASCARLLLARARRLAADLWTR